MKKHLEEQIAEELAEKMMSDIDYNILSDMLVKLGWQRRFVRYQPPEKSWVLVKDWAEKNCKGRHQEHNGVWLFEDVRDANWFTLRWA